LYEDLKSSPAQAIECICPINANVFRAPTTSEFRPGYENNIRTLAKMGIIDDFTLVSSVEEVGPGENASITNPSIRPRSDVLASIHFNGSDIQVASSSSGS
jgi:hypothetical protein